MASRTGGRCKSLMGAMAVAAALALPQPAAGAQLSSAFTADDEGWTTVRTTDAPGASEPNHSATGGNPDGHISGVDQSLGTQPEDPPGTERSFWTFLSPSTTAWIGNRLENYGGTLSFDLRHSATADMGGAVILSTDSNGGMLYGGFAASSFTPEGPVDTTTSPPVANTWTTYSFTVSPGADWTYYPPEFSGDVPHAATEAEFYEVLSRFRFAQVWADLATGSGGQTTQLDNFVWTEGGQPDADGDEIPDNFDDCDNAPGPVENDGCPLPDTDGDGTPDADDTDDDNDGILDGSDPCPTDVASDPDTDGDGCTNGLDDDDDGDTLDDPEDNCPVHENPGQADADADGAGDPCDSDDDNDGVADAGDGCPNGPSSGPDAEGDGCQDAIDPDDDNDGVGDAADACLTTPGPAANGGCPAVADDDACQQAQAKLKKAKKKLKKLKRSDAEAAKVKKAKKKVKKAKQAVKQQCA